MRDVAGEEPMTEAAAAELTRYTVDGRGSRLTINANATGVLSAFGHNPVIAARDMSGDVRFSPEKLDSATVQLRVAAASLAVQNDMSDKDKREMGRKMLEEVLEISKYPDILYEASSARIEKITEGRLRVDLDGRLSLHGVTRSQRVSVQAFVIGDTLRAQGEATVRQTDFGITLVSAAGGTLKIKDEVKCTFDILVRKVA